MRSSTVEGLYFELSHNLCHHGHLYKVCQPLKQRTVGYMLTMCKHPLTTSTERAAVPLPTFEALRYLADTSCFTAWDIKFLNTGESVLAFQILQILYSIQC